MGEAQRIERRPGDRLLVGAVILLLALATLVTGTDPSGATAAGGTASATTARRIPAPHVSPGSPIKGEKFTVTGRLAGEGRRTVVLQRRRDTTGWAAVRRASSRRDGRYQLRYATRRQSVVLRVKVVTPGLDGYQVSRRRTVRTVTDGTSLAMSGSTRSSLATATSVPARPGRAVTLEVLDGAAWRAVGATQPQNAAGQVAFRLSNLPRGSRHYRVHVGPWHGAPSFVGGETDFTPVVSDWAVPAAPEKLTITTEGGVEITSKTEYVGGSMTLGGTTYDLQIRGRGNSTWNWEKKPYRVKLATAASLLGMPAERDWVLLADWADRSGLRNHLALTFGAQQTSLAWTPRDRYVDVVLNDRPIGLYQLVEQVEQSASRVALPDGGMLLEVDRKAADNGDPYFLTEHNVPIAYNDPKDPTLDQQAAVKAAVSALESALYGPDFADPDIGYAAHMNLDSFVDWYLLNEFFANHDSRFNSSVMITWVPGEKFVMGPPWDFDLSAGTGWLPMSPIPPDVWWTREGHDNWYIRLVEDPAFEARIAARWAQLRPAFGQLVDQIPAAADAVSEAAQRDWALWHEDDSDADIGQIHADSLGAEISYVESWMTARLAWLDDQFLAQPSGD